MYTYSLVCALPEDRPKASPNSTGDGKSLDVFVSQILVETLLSPRHFKYTLNIRYTLCCQMNVGNLWVFVGRLKYVQDDDEILKWSLIAAGGVLVIILAAVTVVCVYRRRSSAGPTPDSHSAYLPQHLHRRPKVRYTKPGNGRDLHGTSPARPHEMKTGPVRWNNRPSYSDYVDPVKGQQENYPPSYVHHAIRGNASPISQVGSHPDPTRPGVYLHPSDFQ